MWGCHDFPTRGVVGEVLYEVLYEYTVKELTNSRGVNNIQKVRVTCNTVIDVVVFESYLRFETSFGTVCFLIYSVTYTDTS